MPDPAYSATLEHLYGLRRFGMRPGLEVMRALLDAVGSPERSFRALHVAGSKGKGSVSAMAAAVLGAAGLRVGLYTSPHLVSYRERIRVDGEPVAREAVTHGVERLRGVAERLERDGRIDRSPTFFELTTALAFETFRAARVTHAVVEVGLGGRLDATNVVDAPVGVVTTIELEHTDVLGPTLERIASEKAGILKPGMVGLVGELGLEAAREVERHARGAGVPLLHLGREVRVDDRTLDERGQRLTVVTPRGRHESLRLPLFGPHQAGNAALAVAAVEALVARTGTPLRPTAVLEGLGRVRWRGRLERARGRPELYLDVAHTPESARAAAVGLAEIRPFLDPEANAVVFGCLEDKRAASILEALAPIATTLVVVPIPSLRAMPVEEIRRAATGRFPKVVVAPDVATGLALGRSATAREGLTLALGSDYLVGEILRELEGDPDAEPDLSDPVATPARAGGASR